MKYEKKNLLVVAAAGMLSLVMVSGCGPKETTGKTGDTTTNTTNTTPKPDKKDDKPGTEAAYKFEKVAFTALADFKNLAVSGDKKVYVTASAGRALLSADGADAANLSDPAKWTNIPVNVAIPGFDDTIPGKAKLATASMVVGIKATAKGALVARVAGASSPDNGVGYLEGTDWKAAWNNNGSGLLVLTGTHVVFTDKPKLTTSDVAGVPLLATGVLTKNGEEYPLLFKKDYKYGVTGAVTLNAPNKKLSGWLAFTRNAARAGGADLAFSSNPFVAMLGEDALVVDTAEIRVLKKNDIGSDASVGTLDVSASAAAWNVGGDTNNDVSAVHASADGKKVFIALKTGKNAVKTGGVIVYNVTAGAVPKFEMVGVSKDKKDVKAKSWLNTSVVALANNGDNVYAVTATGLIKVEEDGSMGKALEATGLPAGINDAKFVGDVLVVASATELSKGVVAK